MAINKLIIATNKNGLQLHTSVAGSYAITKPTNNPDPKAAVCTVYHVGKRDYIMRLWKKRYSNSALAKSKAVPFSALDPVDDFEAYVSKTAIDNIRKDTT